MEFNTAFNRVLDPGEVNSGEMITETAGYVPAEKQIMSMIMAGQRLKEARREEFDFAADEKVPDDFIDPTRSPGFDLADGSRIGPKALDRLAQQKKDAAERVKKALEEDEKKAKENGAS